MNNEKFENWERNENINKVRILAEHGKKKTSKREATKEQSWKYWSIAK